jgi:transcriptional regulator with XRE-family HTH domain
MRSEGGRLLAATGLDHATIAVELKVSRQAVQQWITGDKRPGSPRRAAIAKAYGVPAEAWDRQAGRPPVAPEPSSWQGGANAAGPGKSLGDALDAEARVRAQLARLDALRSDPDLLPQARLRLEATEIAAVKELRQITGEGVVVDEAKIVRLPAWRRVVEVVMGALRAHPEAQADVAKALREMGGEG